MKIDIDVKKLTIKLLPHALFFYVAAKCGQAFRLAAGSDTSAKLLNLSSCFAAAFNNPLPTINPQDLITGLIATAFFALMLYDKRQNAKKYRKGVEYGSARWSALS